MVVRLIVSRSIFRAHELPLASPSQVNHGKSQEVEEDDFRGPAAEQTTLKQIGHSQILFFVCHAFITFIH